MRAKAETGENVLAAGPINIGVYFHIIIGSGGAGNISDGNVAAQMKVLNDAFSPHFTFSLLQLNRVVQPAWFNMGTGSEGTAKQALRKGSMQHLNLYTAELADKLLGWSYLPSSEFGSLNTRQLGVTVAQLET